MIKTVDNFQGKANNDKTKKQIENIDKNEYVCEISKNIKTDIHITLKDYILKNNTFFSFFDQEKRSVKNNDDELIISILKKQNEEYIAQTGNFVGNFKWNGVDIEINSRFNKVFLKRMLNFANDIFMDKVDVAGRESKNLDISKFIIYYLFIQKLEKAFLLGLPKAYRTQKHHETKLKGKIDINQFLKKDIPFRGKISSTNREQLEIHEIIDVLYKAIVFIKKDKFNIKNISHVISHLKQNKSNNYVSNQTINKAMNSKALYNPIFAPYKEVLKYAKLIINHNSIDNKYGQANTYGFIINIAELFEIYITKLLRNNFPDWQIESPKIELYEENFFTRKIIPDIVMMKDNKVLVFDTKYKRMQFNGRSGFGLGDVDRCDFFQINTYMSYYKNQEYSVIAGGLLYPLEKEYNKKECFSDNWLGNNKTKFIIDGIELHELEKKEKKKEIQGINIAKKIKEQEKAFLQRIEELISSSYDT